MTDSAAQPAPGPGAGRGRLAQVIATRGGRAAPEAPFVIEHREALIYMLCEAAELEHGIMCQYLFAAFSMKQAAGEGLTPDELAAVTRWRKQISRVATQEMLHLALVQNLLSAIGAAPHMTRPNLPHQAGHYPAGVQLALLPFGERALRHFMFLERPEGMDLGDAEGLAAVGRAIPHLSERDIVPTGQDFATVGHLYRSIEAGFAHLADKYGERWLFVGPPRAQATQQQFSWPELVAVTDLASAQRAIDTILEQGEGPRGDWQDAHFGQFVGILDEFEQMSVANPAFNPVRPVIAANVRPCAPPAEMPLITERLTARVTDLFNVGYEILLQIFERFFAHTEETDEQIKVLADATIALMAGVIKPLGDLITTLPAGPEYDGRTAGPSFELFYENDYLMPHREAAWTLLAERVDQAAWLCQEIQAGPGTGIAAGLAPVAAALTGIAATLAAHLPAGHPQAQQAAAARSLAPGDLRAARSRAGELADAVDGSAGELADLFRAAHAAVTAAGDRPRRGDFVPRLVDSVLRPLAAVISRIPNGARPAAGDGPRRGPGQLAPQAGEAAAGEAAAGEAVAGEVVAGNAAAGNSAARGAAPGGTPAGVATAGGASAGGVSAGDAEADDRVWQAARSATRLRTSLGQAGDCPPELAEATAALQALACDLAAGAEAVRRAAELRQLQAGLPASVQAARNGPYLVTNVPRVLDRLGEPLPVPPQLALCRCGGSSRKPFCDGTHAGNGFDDDKDPDRVPDRRDTYPGQQVTIFDNRGLCQHSGFCTDRLAAVFRTSQEPFVAPSGGRMDEIIRAVRDCPSGALSFGVDGTEARSQRDWGNAREPAIEITRDGPYRITGGIDLTDADGRPMGRNAGASLEHYALCRCGHSQNKPYCSGMHWYIGFRDQQPSAEPTLFEWVGGLPALTRMTRLLYEKLVPADPLLAAAFADMPPGYPEQEAMRLGEAFGGPVAGQDDAGRASGRQDVGGLDVGSRPSGDQTDAALAGAGPASGGRDGRAQAGGNPGDISATSDGQHDVSRVGGGQVSGGPEGAGRREFAAGLTEEQRARWVVLAGQAADEAGLPADPPFRAALASYLEWDSRQAAASPQGGPQQPGRVPAGAALGLDRRRPARRRGRGCRRQPGQPACGGPAAGTRRGGELRGTHPAAVPRTGPAVHVVRLRPVVGRRRPGARGRDPGTAPRRLDALRRRLARGPDRRVPALGRIRPAGLGYFP